MAHESQTDDVALVPRGSRDHRFVGTLQRSNALFAAPVSPAVRALSHLVRFAIDVEDRSRGSGLFLRQGIRPPLFGGSGEASKGSGGAKGDGAILRQPAPRTIVGGVRILP